MHTFFHYGDQLPFALQVSLGIIYVFCILAHVLSSKNAFAFRFEEKIYQMSANETFLLNDETCVPFSIMEINQHLYYKCRLGSFVCFVFSHISCR